MSHSKTCLESGWLFLEKLERALFQNCFSVPVAMTGACLLNDPAVISGFDDDAVREIVMCAMIKWLGKISRGVAIVEAFSSMQQDLTKRWLSWKQWAKGGEQIEPVMEGTVGMCRDLEGNRRQDIARNRRSRASDAGLRGRRNKGADQLINRGFSVTLSL
jgi:hypothetical protein